MIARLRAWLASWVTDAPAGDTSHLDALDGVGTRRLRDDAPRACTVCGYDPGDADMRVVGPCVPGYHELALVGWPTQEERAAGWRPSPTQAAILLSEAGVVPLPTPERADRLLAAIRDCRSDDTGFDEHADDALAFSDPAAEVLSFRGEDYALAARWGIRLAGTAEVDR